MDQVQINEAIAGVERRHLELLAQAERDQLARTLHQWPAKSNTVESGAMVHPLRFAVVTLLLMAMLVVASI